LNHKTVTSTEFICIRVVINMIRFSTNFISFPLLTSLLGIFAPHVYNIIMDNELNKCLIYIDLFAFFIFCWQRLLRVFLRHSKNKAIPDVAIWEAYWVFGYYWCAKYKIREIILRNFFPFLYLFCMYHYI
jgi:hypothetical protein